MNKEEMQNKIALILCNKSKDRSCKECFYKGGKDLCNGHEACRISEKTENQLKYVLSSPKENLYLKACAGSGKTEVVGMKTAYEIAKGSRPKNCGIAVLTFTNDATDVIKDRINQFSNRTSHYPHFIGTLSSFIHQYIGQPFGYKYRNFSGRNGDCSFMLIDKNINPHKNHWLDNYKDFSISAHKTYYDYEKKDFFIASEYGEDKPQDEYFRSERFKSFIKNLNNKCGYIKYTLEDVRKGVIDGKRKFNSHGFANFEDMNNIAYKALINNGKLSDVLSRRFPFIIIDECQDLSWVEIQILNKLRESGSTLHFVGDLNQSVYQFKKVDPDNTAKFVEPFKKITLSDNFRSCRKIVEFSNRLITNPEKISAHGQDKFGDNALVYFEYDNAIDVIHKYSDILNKLKINKDKSSIVVKQNTMKDMLLCIDDKKDMNLMISAVQLWSKGNAYQKQKSLEYAGRQISKWFGGSKNKGSYYCPKDINSVFEWRIFLKNVLNDCCEKDELIDFNQSNGEWHKTARPILKSIIKHRYDYLKIYDELTERNLEATLSGQWFRAKNSPESITSTLEDKKGAKIQVITIHGSKGCTYDSTLVVSSKSERSDSGHWKVHWIEGEGEAKRVGYIASTRAKYLLVWAVPTLSEEDRKLIEGYGFKNIDEMSTTTKYELLERTNEYA
ncbi:MAG: ATP-dependent helicase [Clostridiaceae bacterium]|nr:ATP-dependent helicase [Clostridiaceae bacterium]